MKEKKKIPPPKNQGIKKAKAEYLRDKYKYRFKHYDLDKMSNRQVLRRCKGLQ